MSEPAIRRFNRRSLIQPTPIVECYIVYRKNPSFPLLQSFISIRLQLDREFEQIVAEAFMSPDRFFRVAENYSGSACAGLFKCQLAMNSFTPDIVVVLTVGSPAAQPRKDGKILGLSLRDVCGLVVRDPKFGSWP
jgi:hypothetical protein